MISCMCFCCPQMINVLWWYYFSKLIEFMDTFFFILRKNNHQITFLHVYHHATMLNIWWFVMNWVPCGHCESEGAYGAVYMLNYSDVEKTNPNRTEGRKNAGPDDL